jgi:hypothetical protein
MSQLIKDRTAIVDEVAAYLAKGGVVTVKKSKPRTIKISDSTRAISKAYADLRENKVKQIG